MKTLILLLVVAAASATQMPLCPCTREYNPICGSDGVTYANPCLLRCQMRVDSSLAMVNQGPCHQEDDLQEMPLCACNRMYLPVCGSDGKTYGNPCMLDCAKKQNSGLTMVSYGVCAQHLKAEEPCACPYDYRPVCGTDGATYGNMCALKCQMRMNSGLKLAYSGECGKPVCRCTKELNPVCGSDGVTYNNPCLLKCQQKVNHDLTMVRFGTCAEQLESRSMPPCFCSKEYAPVCGTDGITYPTKCVLDCAKYKGKHDLAMVHSGPCTSTRGLKSLAKACACPLIFMPVCGSDGVTYPNECSLNCKKMDTGSNLQMVHQGHCITAENAEIECKCKKHHYQPVCGSDGWTYQNDCILHCEAKKVNSVLKVDHRGFCELYNREDDVYACPDDYRPVCGSDGKTYANKCMFDHAAKKHPGMFIAHEMEC